jgi:hypothetical protein
MESSNYDFANVQKEKSIIKLLKSDEKVILSAKVIKLNHESKR